MKLKIIRIVLPIFLFLLLSGRNAFAQDLNYEEHAFSNEESICYLKYICYAPNNDYKSYRRPYIFVLGKPNETAFQTFQTDSLKYLPVFINYKFVYIPNKSATLNNSLYCMNGLVSFVTWHYKCGRDNIFLFVYDPALTAPDFQKAIPANTFKTIRFAYNEASLKIADEFKEDIAAYDQEPAKEDDTFGTFYYEESKKYDNELNVDSVKTVVSVKTYYGPPKTFNYTLSGIVKDKSTGETLPFANVFIKGTTTGVSTNVDGYFVLSKVPSDTCTLMVSYLGYSTTEVSLSPFLPKNNFIIEAAPAGNLLKTVTVTAGKEEVVLVRKEDVSVVKITPKEIEKLPNIGEKDVMRSFQLMPGVSASQESSSGLYVRGGTPDQNLVLFDGITVYHVDHLYGFFSAFNANAIKDIQLYKGGFESRFGGRLSSVTEITGKDGNQKKFNMGMDISLLSMNLWAELPIGEKFSSIIALRKSYKGPLYNKLFEKFSKSSSTSTITQIGGPGGRRFGQNAKVTSFFYDLNGKFTYHPTEKDIVTLSIFNGDDKLDNSIDNSSLPSFSGNFNTPFSFSSTDLTKYGNAGSSLKWSRRWTDKFYSNTVLSYSNFYSNRDRSMERTTLDENGDDITTKNGVFENNDLNDFSLKSDYQLDLTPMSQLQWGFTGTYYDIHYSYAQNDTTTILDKKNKALLAGGYLQNKFKLFNNKLNFIPGIRMSYFESTKQIYYEPRASLSYYLTDRLTLKLATGKYNQFANVITREDILSGSKEFWLLSDGKNIPVSSAEHYIAGLSYESNNYLFSTEVYYKKIHNLTEYSLRINPSPTGVDYEENFFTGFGDARGVEFLIQKKTGKFNGWLSYTLGQARNNFKVYSDTYYPANQDVTNEFKIVTLYQWRRWDISATWIFATGRPYTAPSGAYNIKLLDANSQDFFTVTTKNGLRLPDYHRADIAINFKLLAGMQGDRKRREIGYLGFSIFNLYDRTNVWYKTYSIEDGSLIETNVNYTGITPNLSLSIKLR
ncbi:MAG: TonB-dependent receptor [Saprospiraceae bacterium]